MLRIKTKSDFKAKLAHETRIFGVEKLLKEYHGLSQDPDVSLQIFSNSNNVDDSNDSFDPHSHKFLPATPKNLKSGEYREN
jgi:hypothetical protein